MSGEKHEKNTKTEPPSIYAAKVLKCWYVWFAAMASLFQKRIWPLWISGNWRLLQGVVSSQSSIESIGSSKKIIQEFDGVFLHHLELGALAGGVGIHDLA